MTETSIPEPAAPETGSAPAASAGTVAETVMPAQAAASAAETVVAGKPKAKRPVVLLLAAVLMLLAAVLSGASPFLPRLGGVAFGVGPGGARFPNGQRPADGQFVPRQGDGQFPQDGGQFPQDGQLPQGGIRGQGNGQGRVRMNGSVGVFSILQPVRIGLGIAGAVFALLAALGLWGLKTWGRNLTLLVALAGLVSVALGFAGPWLATVSPYLMLLSGLSVYALVSLGLTVAASVLALVPAAQRAYAVKPKVRRVI